MFIAQTFHLTEDLMPLMAALAIYIWRNSKPFMKKAPVMGIIPKDICIGYGISQICDPGPGPWMSDLIISL